MNATSVCPVTDLSQVAEVRREGHSLAVRLGFSDERAGRVALVVTEMATNLAKYSRDGEILIGRLHSHDGQSTGVQIVALDRGPGIVDLPLSRRNGYSTTGTLGHGLGAIERLSDSFDVYSDTSGTIIAAAVLRERPQPAAQAGRYEVGAVQVPKAGEAVSGDAWAWRMRPGRLAVLVADGLGHGQAAHEAASLAGDVFARQHESAPGQLIEQVHAALRQTRGAAVACAAVDLEAGTAAYAGLGNITGTILSPGDNRQHLVSHNGTAGLSAARIQEFTYAFPAGAMLVMQSDGLHTNWRLSAWPGIEQRSPGVIAAALYRDHSRNRDDVTVVVVKERAARQEHV